MILAFYDRYIGVYSLKTLISLIIAHIDKKISLDSMKSSETLNILFVSFSFSNLLSISKNSIR